MKLVQYYNLKQNFKLMRVSFLELYFHRVWQVFLVELSLVFTYTLIVLYFLKKKNHISEYSLIHAFY
jgi:hypothetical protein